jgi:hypothetical protein
VFSNKVNLAETDPTEQDYNGEQVDTVLDPLTDDGDTVLNFPRPRPHFRATGADTASAQPNGVESCGAAAAAL